MRQRRSLTSSLPSRSRRVRASPFPVSRLTTPHHTHRLKPTNFSPPCSLLASASRNPCATAGTTFASDSPLGCSAQAVRPTSFKPVPMAVAAQIAHRLLQG
eukprot:6183820-Pleurochrysis_carterae.AAC.5